MYIRNELLALTRKISADMPKEFIEIFVDKTLCEIGPIFSYTIYADYHGNTLDTYIIRFNISQLDEFNQLDPLRARRSIVDKIFTHLDNPVKKSIIGYGQISLDLLILLFDPLIKKLAKEQHQRWAFLEYEDLCQMCRLVISDLYYKGYYIHKRLIYRAFNNYVLMHIRKDRLKHEIYSLEQEWSKTDNDDYVTLSDMIPDNKMLDDIDDKDNSEVENRILDEMRGIIVDFIGQRQYDQLLREYGNKATTAWSRKLMIKIKAHLFEMGINSKSFAKYYN